MRKKMLVVAAFVAVCANITLFSTCLLNWWGLEKDLQDLLEAPEQIPKEELPSSISLFGVDSGDPTSSLLHNRTPFH